MRMEEGKRGFGRMEVQWKCAGGQRKGSWALCLSAEGSPPKRKSLEPGPLGGSLPDPWPIPASGKTVRKKRGGPSLGFLARSSSLCHKYRWLIYITGSLVYCYVDDIMYVHDTNTILLKTFHKVLNMPQYEYESANIN